MFLLHYLRNTMKVQPIDKRTEDENTIIDFALIYESILPKMKFYKIENILWHRGFDLISYLVTDFKYLGIEFIDLPISYQSIYEKIEIWMVWYDEKLKSKLMEFYVKYFKQLGLDNEACRLEILPKSLLEDKRFENIIANSDKFRVIHKTTKVDNKLSAVIKNLWISKVKEVLLEWNFYNIKCYSLTWFDDELNKEFKEDINLWNEILKNYIGIHARFYHKSLCRKSPLMTKNSIIFIGVTSKAIKFYSWLKIFVCILIYKKHTFSVNY